MDDRYRGPMLQHISEFDYMETKQMQFTVDAKVIPVQPVDITLKLDQYCGAMLPTLYANNIPVLHILDDGRIVLRSKGETNVNELRRLGFALDCNQDLITVKTSVLNKEKPRSGGQFEL
jgi:hypothetical protein